LELGAGCHGALFVKSVMHGIDVFHRWGRYCKG
jgi:hypothetical protein